jgi:hypothetical protein
MTHQCENNVNNNHIGFLDVACPYWKHNNGILINKYNRTHIVPQYLSLDMYDAKHISNICILCEVCWRNRYNNIRKLYPSNRVTDNIKLEFLYKVKPHLIIGDTIYRQMKINNINRIRYTHDEINRGCSTMDIDNDPLIL